MGLLGLSLTATGLAVGPSASAAPQPKLPTTAPAVAEPAHADHDLPNPLEDKRRALRQEGLSKVLSGEATAKRVNGSTVVKVGETAAAAPGSTSATARAARGKGGKKDQYVELSREKTDQIFVILAEFGNERHPDYPDKDLNPDWAGPNRFDGPLHNEIPKPNRAVDNSTVWQADYSPEYFRKLYFGTKPGDESVKQYYEAQSSGRYSVDGVVSNWVKVKHNEARYGRSLDPVEEPEPGEEPDPNDDPAVCSSNVCQNTWELVRDAANQWVADQKAQGRTDAQIAADVKAMDKWDRYDFDGDGNFNESDGYIDHFQIVHSGGDMADGDPNQGEDAIWSHRWYAFANDQGVTGPSVFPAGGTQIGNTGVWIGDYTIQPENGGRSVFYHEYAHDLGLPDDYNVNVSADNNNEHWTLMAQSRLSGKNDGGIGERGGDLGAWNKLQLGWLDYEVIVAGQKRTLELGPQEYNSAKPQAAVVVLPEREYTFNNPKPAEGTKQFFSGNADGLNNTMTRTIDLTGKSSASLSMKGNYNIERDYDYLYFEGSLDGGATWSVLPGTVNGQPIPPLSNQDPRPALTGSSGGKWADITIPMDFAAGKVAQFRMRYATDGGVSSGGFFGDAITVTADGQTVLTEGAEAGAPGWELDGWEIVEETYTRMFANYYIAGHRSYVSYDKYLKTGPYFFGYANTRPDWVDHYAYQEGLLISYWNLRWADNDTVNHPGEGRNLYIDAHPRPIYNLTGQPWRARVQVYDAPFSLKKADSFTLHLNSQPQYIRGQAAQPLFDDTKKYWYSELPNHGVKLPATGTKIKVLEQKGTSVKVRFS
ncbi:immune inhibitor A domain-containing protein [Micromonospora endolithica]|uniref:M6 family metalloprotease domain-containing protein n=1 Tax=Micromonospora endolithica TaxID=230091 RepID=A0A3A9ZJU9_9ACTN|nr:immune inhibitor A domain-containing protein [Micromonospora endolithica]RKN48405.1 M6 family metalloprotease domain-containing protein [Micromonospora endolithica]